MKLSGYLKLAYISVLRPIHPKYMKPNIQNGLHTIKQVNKIIIIVRAANIMKKLSAILLISILLISLIYIL